MLEAALSNGSPETAFNVATAFLESGRKDRAVAAYQRAAARGHAQAKQKLGTLGVALDPAQAVSQPAAPAPAAPPPALPPPPTKPGPDTSCDCLPWRSVGFGVNQNGKQVCGNGPACAALFELKGNECADPGRMEGYPWCYVSDACTKSVSGAAARWKRCQ